MNISYNGIRKRNQRRESSTEATGLLHSGGHFALSERECAELYAEVDRKTGKAGDPDHMEAGQDFDTG